MNTVTDLQAPLNGYIVTETIRRVYLPAVMSLEPNQGHVGKLLASLMADYDEVVVPNAISATLTGMLQRRNFKPEQRWAPEMDTHAECWVWRNPNERQFPTQATIVEAATDLANIAAHACTEPRAFHANEGGLQQALGKAVARMRTALRGHE